MKLIYEIDSKPEFVVSEELNEATGVSSKKYKIKGIFSTIGEKNRNGRIYPRAIWESEVAKYQQHFSNGSFNTLMEWEHPSRTDIDPMQAIAKIEKLYIKDNYVMGEAVLLDNEKANQLKTLIDNGIKISVSSRGVGSVKNGIVENFQLITFDCVSMPSDRSASMNGMVESYKLNEGILENKEFIINENGNIEEIQMCSESACHMFKKEEIQEATKQKFKEILAEIAKK